MQPQQREHSAHAAPCVGIIANPVSARDIRRIVANASNLQIADRVNNRVARAHGAGRDARAARADHAGQRRHPRHADAQPEPRTQPAPRLPEVEFLDMEPTSTVDDTFLAARMMRAAGVKAIVVLGGDGTHRAVVRECKDVPIAGLSTGTNNAFPEMRESTITAMAVGLYATGRLSAGEALAPNKLLEVSINEGRRHDIALVDAVISTERYIGARALWKTESLSAVYLTFADPQAIGLSAIGGLLQPLGRREPGGLAVHLSDDPATRRLSLHAPIAPGMVREVGIARCEPMPAGQPFAVALEAGVVALDGERELAFDPGERVRQSRCAKTLSPTVTWPAACRPLHAMGLFRHFSTTTERRHTHHGRQESLPMSRDELLKCYRTMGTIRAFEERLHIDFGRGDIPGFVTFTPVKKPRPTGIMSHLGDGDRIASTHRGHGHCISKGVDVIAMMKEIYGRKGGACNGIGRLDAHR